MDEKEAEARPVMGTIFLVNDQPNDQPQFWQWSAARKSQLLVAIATMYNSNTYSSGMLQKFLGVCFGEKKSSLHTKVIVL